MFARGRPRRVNNVLPVDGGRRRCRRLCRCRCCGGGNFKSAPRDELVRSFVSCAVLSLESLLRASWRSLACSTVSPSKLNGNGGARCQLERPVRVFVCVCVSACESLYKTRSVYAIARARERPELAKVSLPKRARAFPRQRGDGGGGGANKKLVEPQRSRIVMQPAPTCRASERARGAATAPARSPPMKQAKQTKPLMPATTEPRLKTTARASRGQRARRAHKHSREAPAPASSLRAVARRRC